jgi:hypothetical protein
MERQLKWFVPKILNLSMNQHFQKRLNLLIISFNHNKKVLETFQNLNLVGQIVFG